MTCSMMLTLKQLNPCTWLFHGIPHWGWVEPNTTLQSQHSMPIHKQHHMQSMTRLALAWCWYYPQQCCSMVIQAVEKVSTGMISGQPQTFVSHPLSSQLASQQVYMRQLSWSKFLWGIFLTFIFPPWNMGFFKWLHRELVSIVSLLPPLALQQLFHNNYYLICNNSATCGLVPISAPTLQATFVSTLTWSKAKWLGSIILTNDFYWNWICWLLQGIWLTPTGHLINSGGTFDWLLQGIDWLLWGIWLTPMGHL